jgi:arginyl-tRNA synthetase
VDALAEHNEARRRDVVRRGDAVRARRAACPAPRSADYPWAKLRERIGEALRRHFGRDELAWEMDLLDRARFQADVAVRVVGLLTEHGAKAYVRDDVPAIVEALAGVALADVVAAVEPKGIYVNLRLADDWFLAGVQAIIDGGERFGPGDTRAGFRQIVDYSSPNVAKVLHAGHFRSTILGHVLSNLYEACGATVYRINHINDFGGFGFMLEGFRRFQPYFPATMAAGDQLLEVYAVRRALERAVAAGGAEVAEPDRQLLGRYFPGSETAEDLQGAYAGFVAAADERFKSLEEGDAEEVALWRQMVDWSLAEFRSFYSALGIEIDFVIGESFYLQAGNAVVDEAIRAGTAYELTEEIVRAEVAALDRVVASEAMTATVRDRTVELLRKDIGAVVVPLPGGERLVVRRSDGRSIYATRDVGAIKLRGDIFDPTHVTYVVGQEQRVHFARLFAAARVLGLATAERPRFKHASFGFYVDAATGRKLSSRDSVESVTELLAAAITYFREKSAASGTMTEEELDEAAQQLAVGSIVFNDLKRDMKGSVSIPRGEVASILADFEKSGGAYVVYSACRARAILRRYGQPVPRLAEVGEFEISDQEALLISRMFELPEAVAKAAAEDNPAVLVRHLLAIAGTYHSYYSSAPVLEGGRANKSRLMITWAAYLVLSNGLRICHVECPAKI